MLNIYLSLSSRTNSQKTPSLKNNAIDSSLYVVAFFIIFESKMVNFTVGYLANTVTFSISYASEI